MRYSLGNLENPTTWLTKHTFPLWESKTWLIFSKSVLGIGYLCKYTFKPDWRLELGFNGIEKAQQTEVEFTRNGCISPQLGWKTTSFFGKATAIFKTKPTTDSYTASALSAHTKCISIQIFLLSEQTISMTLVAASRFKILIKVNNILIHSFKSLIYTVASNWGCFSTTSLTWIHFSILQ